MPRPCRPSWFAPRKCWRGTVGGKRVYFGRDIPPTEKPQLDGVPRRAWAELEALLEAERGRSTAGSVLTVHWLAQLFAQAMESEVTAGRLGDGQLDNHLGALRTFLAFPGVRDRPAAALSVDLLDDFFEHFRETPLERTGAVPSAHHVHNVGKTVRAMYRWAARPVKGREPARLVTPNPLEGYKFPGQPGAVRGYVEGAVVRRFLRWAWADARRAPVGSVRRRHDRLFVMMLRFQRLTGCRPGEATGLEWAEISPPPPPIPADGDIASRPRWEPKLIEVRPEKVKTRRQTTRARRIHVTPPVARLLRAIERLPGRHPSHVFSHTRGRGAEGRGEVDPVAGEPWADGSAASHRLARLRAAAVAVGLPGIETVGPRKLVAYASRHAFASEASSLGFSDEQVSEQMGNTPEVMRRVYAHSINGEAAARAKEIASRRRRIRAGDEPAGPAA